MSRISRLIQAYSRFIAIPWRDDVAAAQRVIFCVYHEDDELRLRASIDEFELATHQAGHVWSIFDLTDTFAHWLTGQRYVRSYFQRPQRLSTLLPKYPAFITQQFEALIAEAGLGPDSVVALKGVGSLFGLVRVRSVVDQLAPRCPGRLLVFFPGSYENNTYRLLDGYDGWNYLALPITAGKEP